MGYHWQFVRRGSYLLHLMMVVTRDRQAELRVLYHEEKYPADKNGWKAFLAYLEKERFL
jgi:hypothetical protein